jgi:hypothetical protein
MVWHYAPWLFENWDTKHSLLTVDTKELLKLNFGCALPIAG